MAHDVCSARSPGHASEFMSNPVRSFRLLLKSWQTPLRRIRKDHLLNQWKPSHWKLRLRSGIIPPHAIVNVRISNHIAGSLTGAGAAGVFIRRRGLESVIRFETVSVGQREGRDERLIQTSIHTNNRFFNGKVPSGGQLLMGYPQPSEFNRLA